jgi:hypothetical protein
MYCDQVGLPCFHVLLAKLLRRSPPHRELCLSPSPTVHTCSPAARAGVTASLREGFAYAEACGYTAATAGQSICAKACHSVSSSRATPLRKPVATAPLAGAGACQEGWGH